MPDNTLDTEVKALLVKRRGNWQSIVDGAKVSHSWLSKFVRDEIPNPGYATLKKVHDCLTGKDKPKTAKKAAA